MTRRGIYTPWRELVPAAHCRGVKPARLPCLHSQGHGGLYPLRPLQAPHIAAAPTAGAQLCHGGIAVDRRAFFQALFDQYDRMALPAYQRTSAREKPDGTAVTELDLKANRLVCLELSASFPLDGIISEEDEGLLRPAASRQWIVDPVDGTSSFARGYPIWGLGIGLMVDGVCQEGYLRFPALNESFMHLDGTSQFNGRPLTAPVGARIRDTRNLLVGSRVLEDIPIARLQGFKLRNLGSNLYHLACLAAGRADAVISPPAYLWDMAPALPLLTAQGHVARYSDGTPFAVTDFVDRRAVSQGAVLFGPQDLLAELLAML